MNNLGGFYVFAERVLKCEKYSLIDLAKLAKDFEDVIYLNVGEPDFTTPKHILDAAKEAMEKGYTRYTPDEGITELREAIAEKESQKIGTEIKKEQVLITAGSTGGVFAAIMSLVNPGEEVLIQDPWYPGHLRSITLAGGKTVEVPQIEEKDYDLDLDTLSEKVTKKTKLLILISPNNPTGAVLDYKTLKGIAEIAIDNNFYVLSDEVYEKFVYDGKFTSIAEIPGMEERTIIINSFSKTYCMTGLRIGYAVASQQLIEQMSKVACAANLSVTSIVQYAALAALKGPQDYVEEMVKEYGERRKLALRKLREISEIKTIEPKGAFYVFPNIEKIGVSSKELVEYLVRDARVLVSPGYPFFGSGGKRHIRISYTVPRDKLEIALERMKESIEKII